jgi:ribonuclease HI
VSNRAEAAAPRNGRGARLAPGQYLVVDGNAAGGMGLLAVRQGDSEAPARVIQERADRVWEALPPDSLPGLSSPDDVRAALARLRNVLAEMAAAYIGLARMPFEPGPLTIVHDYAGVAAWLEGRWARRDPAIRALADAAVRAAQARALSLRFLHASWAGHHALAALNARADRLAAEAI